MDWDFRSEFDKTTLQETKNWFNFWFYILPTIPLLVGSFAGAHGEDLRFFPLILLVLTVALGRTSISALASLRGKQGVEVTCCPYIFEVARFPFGVEVLRFVTYLTAVLTLVCGFILCLVRGFGVLTFGLFSLLAAAAYLSGYAKAKPGVPAALAFFSQGFVLTAVAYYCQAGAFSASVLALSLPLGFMLAALVLRLEMDGEIYGGGKPTAAQLLGSERGEKLYLALVFLAYGFVVLNVLYGVSGFWCLLLLLLVPLLKKEIVSSEKFLHFYVKFGFLYAFCMLLRFTF